MTETTPTRLSTERAGGAVAFGLAGVVLLANPAYLDSLSVYPGIGWEILPLFHAALGSTGMLLVGIAGALATGRAGEPRAVLAVAGFALAGFVGYDVVLALLGEFDPVAGYATRRFLLASLVAAGFALGASLPGGHLRTAAAGVALPIPGLVAFLADWRFDPILEPVLDLAFFLRAEVVLGIPYLGSVLLVAAVVLGIGWSFGGARAGHETGREDVENV